MGEVILLLALDNGGQATPPQLGAGSPQQQLMQAGQRPFPLGRNSQAPEPLTRLLIEKAVTSDARRSRTLRRRHAPSLKGLP